MSDEFTPEPQFTPIQGKPEAPWSAPTGAPEPAWSCPNVRSMPATTVPVSELRARYGRKGTASPTVTSVRESAPETDKPVLLVMYGDNFTVKAKPARKRTSRSKK